LPTQQTLPAETDKNIKSIQEDYGNQSKIDIYIRKIQSDRLNQSNKK